MKVHVTWRGTKSNEQREFKEVDGVHRGATSRTTRAHCARGRTEGEWQWEERTMVTVHCEVNPKTTYQYNLFIDYASNWPETLYLSNQRLQYTWNVFRHKSLGLSLYDLCRTVLT